MLRALRKAPGDRYASVDQLSEDILRHLEQRPVLARGDSPWYLAARFVRRNTVAVAAATLMLCALVGGLIEVSIARGRAERRFDDVHRIAHAVIFDYADAIGHLAGSTPVRERLVKDALTYLDSLSNEADSPQLQREIVDAYVRVSNVQGDEYANNLGNTTGALASAAKAVAAAAKLLRTDHGLAALDTAANAYSTQGSLFYATGDLHNADGAYRRALALRDDIAQRDPQALENQLALITCLDHIGDLYGGYGFQNLGRTQMARAYYLRANALATQLYARFPANDDVIRQSYEVLLSLSSSENAAGQYAAATRDLALALSRIEAASARQPHDANVRYERANAESRLGQMLLDARQADAAVAHAARSASLLQALLAADPTNANYRRGQAVVENQWAAALRGTNHIAESLTHNANGLRLAQALNHDAPNSAQYRLDVGITERKFSDGLVAAGKAAAALPHAQAAVKILCHDAPATANCGRAELATGNAWLALHNPLAAVAVLRKAEAIASGQALSDAPGAIAISDEARARAALAAALAMAGDTRSAAAKYQAALTGWARLKQAQSITAEDAYRSEQAARALMNLD